MFHWMEKVEVNVPFAPHADAYEAYATIEAVQSDLELTRRPLVQEEIRQGNRPEDDRSLK